MHYLYWLSIDNSLAKVLDAQKCHEYHVNREAALSKADLYSARDDYPVVVLPYADVHGAKFLCSEVVCTYH